MTDSEKIAALIQDKHLTNAQFCAATDLQPAALSHIMSGRSKPSLSILRSIVRGFPDVNPMWLFGDEENMYRDTSASVAPSSPSSVVEDDAPSSADSPTQGGLFPESETPDNAPQTTDTTISPATAQPSDAVGAPVPVAQVQTPAAEVASPPSVAAAGTVIIPQVPAPEPPPRRNIVEIRVFYDDNTFEILTRKP